MIKIIDTSNHGKVGKALYIKYTVDKFNEHFSEPQDIKDGDVFTPEELENKFFRVSSIIPIHIDNTTQGEYECVCEFGTEIW